MQRPNMACSHHVSARIDARTMRVDNGSRIKLAQGSSCPNRSDQTSLCDKQVETTAQQKCDRWLRGRDGHDRNGSDRSVTARQQ